jgi:hypothetical protein
MDDRFDQEFYKSEWQRALPLGPHGIQPYVRTSRNRGHHGPGCNRVRALDGNWHVQAVAAVGD